MENSPKKSATFPLCDHNNESTDFCINDSAFLCEKCKESNHKTHKCLSLSFLTKASLKRSFQASRMRFEQELKQQSQEYLAVLEELFVSPKKRVHAQVEAYLLEYEEKETHFQNLLSNSITAINKASKYNSEDIKRAILLNIRDIQLLKKDIEEAPSRIEIFTMENQEAIKKEMKEKYEELSISRIKDQVQTIFAKLDAIELPAAPKQMENPILQHAKSNQIRGEEEPEIRPTASDIPSSSSTWKEKDIPPQNIGLVSMIKNKLGIDLANFVEEDLKRPSQASESTGAGTEWSRIRLQAHDRLMNSSVGFKTKTCYFGPPRDSYIKEIVRSLSYTKEICGKAYGGMHYMGLDESGALKYTAKITHEKREYRIIIENEVTWNAFQQKKSVMLVDIKECRPTALLITSELSS